jgi:hypothetical protein
MRLKRWGEFLTAVAVKENVCIVAPIATSNWPPSPFKHAYGTDLLPMLHLVMEARTSVEDGTFVIQKTLTPPMSNALSANGWIGKWLATASDKEIAEATGPVGLSLASMDVASRLETLSSIGLTQDVVEGFVLGGDESKLNVRFTVDVRGKDATGRELRYRIDPRPRSIPSPEDLSPKSGFSRLPADKLNGRSGELDFGNGQVVTVSALKASAKTTFGRDFESDQRLDGSYLFLAGRFNFDELLSAVRYALDVPRAQAYDEMEAMSKEEITRLALERLSGLLESFKNATGVDPRWAMERRTMSAAALAEIDAGFKAYLDSRGINPSTLSVSLVPTILFQASAPGTTLGVSTEEGRPGGSTLHNFGFAFHPGK